MASKFAMVLVLAFWAGSAYAQKEQRGNMTVYVGDNGQSAPKKKAANTTYWVQPQSGSDEISRNVQGLIYSKNSKTIGLEEAS